MTDLQTLGDRIKHAMQYFAARQPDKTTDPAAFGQAVGEIEGTRAHTADVVFAWVNNERVPAYSTMLAMAALTGRRAEAQIKQLLYGAEWPIFGLCEADYRKFHHVDE